MTYKIYYKRFLDGVNKPVICSKNDAYHLVDLSILKDEVGKSFDADDPKNTRLARLEVLKSNGGENISFKNAYVGETTITWHFAKNAVEEGDIAF